MERLKHIKEMILDCVQGEICNLPQADTKELGEAIDMLKDLEEAIYYSTITEAMNAKEQGDDRGKEVMYYPYPMYYPANNSYSSGDKGMEYYDPYRDMDRHNGKMYYNGGSGSSSSRSGGNSNMGSGGNSGGSRSYQEMEYPRSMDMRDRREGRSPMNRKMYMEAKEMHHGKESQLKELENYMHELTNDVTEMIKDSSPEEKQLMQKKIAALAEKVGQINV